MLGYIGAWGYFSLKVDGSSHHCAFAIVEVKLCQGEVAVREQLDFRLVQVFAYLYFTQVLAFHVVLQQIFLPSKGSQIYLSVFLVDGFTIEALVFTGSSTYATYITKELALAIE